MLKEIKYEQVNIVINERNLKINRQNKIIHMEIQCTLKIQYRDKIVSPDYRSCIYLLSVNTVTIYSI